MPAAAAAVSASAGPSPAAAAALLAGSALVSGALILALVQARAAGAPLTKLLKITAGVHLTVTTLDVVISAVDRSASTMTPSLPWRWSDHARDVTKLASTTVTPVAVILAAAASVIQARTYLDALGHEVDRSHCAADPDLDFEAPTRAHTVHKPANSSVPTRPACSLASWIPSSRALAATTAVVAAAVIAAYGMTALVVATPMVHTAATPSGTMVAAFTAVYTVASFTAVVLSHGVILSHRLAWFVRAAAARTAAGERTPCGSPARVAPHDRVHCVSQQQQQQQYLHQDSAAAALMATQAWTPADGSSARDLDAGNVHRVRFSGEDEEEQAAQDRARHGVDYNTADVIAAFPDATHFNADLDASARSSWTVVDTLQGDNMLDKDYVDGALIDQHAMVPMGPLACVSVCLHKMAVGTALVAMVVASGLAAKAWWCASPVATTSTDLLLALGLCHVAWTVLAILAILARTSATIVPALHDTILRQDMALGVPLRVRTYIPHGHEHAPALHLDELAEVRSIETTYLHHLQAQQQHQQQHSSYPKSIASARRTALFSSSMTDLRRLAPLTRPHTVVAPPLSPVLATSPAVAPLLSHRAIPRGSTPAVTPATPPPLPVPAVGIHCNVPAKATPPLAPMAAPTVALAATPAPITTTIANSAPTTTATPATGTGAPPKSVVRVAAPFRYRTPFLMAGAAVQGMHEGASDDANVSLSRGPQ
ncbi:hypothetical protein AMAG_01143 [Allomyces macrogynus ATCC 38327]|uniref:Uncharacterized protein n=1 Tax=Allomyces macrogynus (strain ATCC 38327) TaxID=578462 RepID=A0A0L0RYR0_ALLM3|nr:hypothetical protein AMAG_01143 [Allomyces macrogynus ATCC 38327]|eukprot:KNE55229.1 hypothetical protein AMAG_01143 [Allomyces macrogynus ATCC 38327]